MAKGLIVNRAMVDDKTVDQFNMCMNLKFNGKPIDIIGVLHNDGHFGFGYPIGATIGCEGFISIVGVGSDIGCGNAAHLYHTTELPSQDQLKRLYDVVAFNKIKVPLTTLLNEYCVNTNDIEFKIKEMKEELYRFKGLGGITVDLIQRALDQLGSIGSGNHFLNIMKDKDASHKIWLAVHSGSRSFGYNIAKYFLHKALNVPMDQRIDENNIVLPLIEYDSDMGKDYMLCMNLALRYADLNRKIILKIASSILGLGNISYQKKVENHHNYCVEETYNDKTYVVVRKGATRIDPGKLSFIGSNMLNNSYIVGGVYSELLETHMYTTVHGAGRVMSRHQALKNINYETIKELALNKGVYLFGGDADESPAVYKNLDEVLKDQLGKCLEIKHTLIPYCSMMCD